MGKAVSENSLPIEVNCAQTQSGEGERLYPADRIATPFYINAEIITDFMAFMQQIDCMSFLMSYKYPL